MSIFKQATKQGIRFNTSKGLLSVEQLWGLSMTRLATIVRGLKKELEKNNDDDLSFLDEASAPVDKELQLRFDVAKAIYLDIKTERDAVRDEAAKKARNQKIMALIAEKEEEGLKNLTKEELAAMLEE